MNEGGSPMARDLNRPFTLKEKVDDFVKCQNVREHGVRSAVVEQRHQEEEQSLVQRDPQQQGRHQSHHRRHQSDPFDLSISKQFRSDHRRNGESGISVSNSRRQGSADAHKSAWHQLTKDLEIGVDRRQAGSSKTSSPVPNKNKTGQPDESSKHSLSSSKAIVTRTPTRADVIKIEHDISDTPEEARSSPAMDRQSKSVGNVHNPRQDDERMLSPIRRQNKQSSLEKAPRRQSQSVIGDTTTTSTTMTPKKSTPTRMGRQYSVESVDSLPQLPDDEEDYDQMTFQQKMRIGYPDRIKKSYSQSASGELSSKSMTTTTSAKPLQKRIRNGESVNREGQDQQRQKQQQRDGKPKAQNMIVDEIETDTDTNSDQENRIKKKLKKQDLTSNDRNPFLVDKTTSSSGTSSASSHASKPKSEPFFKLFSKRRTSGGNSSGNSTTNATSNRASTVNSKTASTTPKGGVKRKKYTDKGTKSHLDSDSSSDGSESNLEDFQSIWMADDEKSNTPSRLKPYKDVVPPIVSNGHGKDPTDMSASPTVTSSSTDKKRISSTPGKCKANHAHQDRAKSPKRSIHSNSDNSLTDAQKTPTRQHSPKTELEGLHPQSSPLQRKTTPSRITFKSPSIFGGGYVPGASSPLRTPSRIGQADSTIHISSVMIPEEYLEPLSPPPIPPSESPSWDLYPSIAKSPKKRHSSVDLRSPDYRKSSEGSSLSLIRGNINTNVRKSPSFLSVEKALSPPVIAEEDSQEKCPYCGDPLPVAMTERLARALAKVKEREEERKNLWKQKQQQQQHLRQSSTKTTSPSESDSKSLQGGRKVVDSETSASIRTTAKSGNSPVASVTISSSDSEIGNTNDSDDEDEDSNNRKLSTKPPMIKKQPRPRPVRRSRPVPIIIESSSDESDEQSEKVSRHQKSEFILDEPPLEETNDPSNHQSSQHQELSLHDKFEFCRIHIAEARIVPIGEARNYPMHIRWYELPQRVHQMRHDLQGIIDRRVQSTFLDEAQERYRKMGGQNARRAGAIFASLDHVMPGYYGSRGSHELFKILGEMFLDTKVLTKEKASPQQPVEFIQQVLIPEATIRLIAEDSITTSSTGVTLEEARKIMHESAEFGNYMQELNPVL
ncbi:hypothetical protein BGW42_004111 [Actinomortierella wolfii]|nr:hypothetical protein BGW42_004111 [Actinomortierella wolfii]